MVSLPIFHFPFSGIQSISIKPIYYIMQLILAKRTLRLRCVLTSMFCKNFFILRLLVHYRKTRLLCWILAVALDIAPHIKANENVWIIEF